MKLFHLSDLHIGKRVNEFSMLEDQKYILMQILKAAKEHQPDGIILAGDIYDKPVPAAEAVQVFDDFLTSLNEMGLIVFMISGNHDSPERVSYGGRLMKKSGIYVAPVYEGKTEKVEFTDAYGKVCIHLLPFVKPAVVRHAFEEGEFEKEAEAVCDYQSAVKMTVSHMAVDTDVRNVLIAHQFVTGAMRCESEEVSVGGLDNVDASVFDGFDYVALGHIHSPQAVGRDQVRYCGTPLKYSFSEAGQEKSITVVELKEKGNCSVRKILLHPKTKLAVLKDKLENLLSEAYQEFRTGYYLSIRVTDEEILEYPVQRLQQVFSGMLECRIENRRTLAQGIMETADLSAIKKTPESLFAEFYEKQNGIPMNEIEKQILRTVLGEMEEMKGDTN